MNTLHTTILNDKHSKTILFRELFFQQMLLSRYDDSQFDHCQEVQEVIEKLDQLMEALLDDHGD